MMPIPSKEYPHLTVFHSVDRHWKGKGYIISFLPQLEEEARTFIAGLLPYLRYKVGTNKHQDINKCFTRNAAQRADKAKWDPDLNWVVTEEDTWVSELNSSTLDGDYQFDLEELDTNQAEKRQVPDEGVPWLPVIQ
jgi:hypothetical protein